MEKINNYTPGPWKEINNDTRSVWFGVQGSNGKRVCNCRNHNDAKLIVTLYEQHFKMLELLKGDLYFIKIELKERLKFSDINTDDKTKAMSDRIKELEQTIKECEL